MIKITAIFVLLALLTVVAGACGEDEPRELVVLTNDSFDISQEVISEFETANNATVIIQKAGSSGEVLNRAILEKGNPSGDVLYGIDNTYLSRALREDIFVKYESSLLDHVPDQFVFDKTFHVSPVDYGYVNLNYDKEYLDQNNLSPPSTLEELTSATVEGKACGPKPGDRVAGPGVSHRNGLIFRRG